MKWVSVGVVLAMVSLVLIPSISAMHGDDGAYTTLFISSFAYLGEDNATTGDYEVQVSMTYEPTGYGSDGGDYEVFLGYIHVANIDYYPNITDVLVVDPIIGELIDNDTYVQAGNNVTVNATIIEEDIESVFIRFWQGLVTLWEGFMELVDGTKTLFTITVPTNESWVGEVNFTINATEDDRSGGKSTIYNGSFFVDNLIFNTVVLEDQVIPVSQQLNVSGLIDSTVIDMANENYYVYFDGVLNQTNQFNGDSTFNFSIMMPGNLGNHTLMINTSKNAIYEEFSTWIFVDNLPYVTGIVLNPVPSYANDTLIANWTFNDLDSQQEISYYRWYINGVPGPSGSVTGTDVGAMLGSGNFVKHDNITVEITPYDGYLNGSASTSAVLEIINSIPITRSISLPAVYTNETLNCIINATDTDNDTLTYWYRFSNDTHLLQDWSTSQFDCSNPGCDHFVNMTCEAKVADDEVNNTVQNATVQIPNKEPYMVTINVTPSNFKLYDNITIETVGAFDVDLDSYRLECGNETNTDNICISEYVSSGETSCTFNNTFWADDSVHNIYCRLNDTYNYSQERMFGAIVDNTKATITPLYPPQNYIEEESFGIEFRYQVNDTYLIPRCEIYINGVLNQTKYNPLRNSEEMFNITFNNGFYQWKIGCYDEAYNYNETRIFNLTIDTTERLTINPIQDVNVEENENITLSRNVLLVLDIIETTKYCQYSNDMLTWSSWEECASTKAWVLSSGYGMKTVYARINHTGVAAGKITMINDTINYSEDGSELITTLPSDFNVYDEGMYTNSNDTLRFHWTDASNNEMRKLGLGLNYSYMLNDTTASTSITPWVNVGSQRNATITGLSLIENHTYALIVKAMNPNSKEKIGFSNGIITDFTGPAIDWIVSDPINGTWTNINDILINWSGSDELSGIQGYSMVFNTETVDHPDNTVDEIISSKSISDLEEGQYYLHIKAIDNAQNPSVTYNYGPLNIDLTPPSEAVADNPNEYIDDQDYEVTFEPSIDLLSGISHYNLYLYDQNRISISNATTTGNNHTFGNLSAGNYFVMIEAFDNANNSAMTTDPSLIPLLITFASPNNSVTVTEPIIIARTNKDATCTQNHSAKRMIYTGDRYHETKLELPAKQYSIRITCEDGYGYRDSKDISFETLDLLPGSMNLGSYPQYYENQIITLYLTTTDRISTIKKNSLKLYVNDSLVKKDAYSISQVDDNNYTLKMDPFEIGNYMLKVRYHNLESNNRTIDVKKLKVTIAYSSTVSSTKKNSQLIINGDENKSIGVATESADPEISENISRIGLNADTNKPSYLFITSNKINVRSSNNLLKDNEFVKEKGGFGIAKQDSVIKQKLDYGIIDFEGVNFLPKGRYDLILINMGKNDKGQTIVRVEQVED